MAPRIPDLWALGEDAGRLYSLFLLELELREQHERAIQAIRRIRQYAIRGPGVKEALPYFSQEIELLCELGRYHEAWLQLRRRDRLFFGSSIDYSRHTWPEEFGWSLIYTTAPLLYLTGQFELGRRVMEAGLEIYYRHNRDISFELLQRVHDPQAQPRWASLSHFYQKLGLDLGQWKDWDTFVDGFPVRFFPAVGVPREDLRRNAKLLDKVVRRVKDLREERCISGNTQGIKDIIDSPEKVRRWHEWKIREARKSKPALQQQRDRSREKLLKYFPELRPSLRGIDALRRKFEPGT
jgi:hypothetical protein